MSNKISSNCFDVLRLFAAVCVVFSHSTEHLKIPFLWHKPGGLLWFWDGVPLFFVLSGMLVYLSYERCAESGRPLRDFYISRFLRVGPLIYVYSVLTPVFLVAIGAISLGALKAPAYWAWLASNWALVPVYHPSTFRSFGIGVLNGSLWTIPVEVSFYAIVPVLFLCERRIGFRKTFGGLALVVLAGQVVDWWLQEHDPEALTTKLFSVTFLPYLPFFAAGIFWLKTWNRVSQRIEWALLCVAVYLVVRLGLASVGWTGALGPFWHLAWGLPLSYAVVWFGYHAPRQINSITRIGDLSYGVYVWHMVVINIFIYLYDKYIIFNGLSTAVHLLVLSASLGLALCSWWLIERPALKMKPFSTRPIGQGGPGWGLRIPHAGCWSPMGRSQ
jgi:peptidoglycan/LPS O-acetylase OafA/YrhL